MKSFTMLIYSISAYLVGFASIVYWILSVSHLIPEISIDQEPRVPFLLALLNNFVLVALFGVQHSIMARPWFKDFFSSYFPRAIERSTFILVSGLLLFFLVIQWQPLGGLLWDVSSNVTLNYIIYTLFFIGWSILFISTFLINHLDFFGLRQVYFEIMKKPYNPLNFKVVGFYKYMRHPIYFGGMLGLWATPVMTGTHLVFAIFLSAYFIIGTFFEEKDLRQEFGNLYKHYVENTPMYVPFTKKSNTKEDYLKRINKLKSETMFWMLFTMFSIAATTAQTVAIPDSNFEQALIDAGQDSDGTINGLILQSDAEAINTLALNNKGINSLQGIEGFINITSLVCSNNNLTSINFSSNTVLQTLDCSNNNLTSLDISDNSSLTSLIAINSQLTSLDVSNNTLLTYLSVPFNQLTNLNISNNTVLETMYVHSNELTSLDVSNLTLLQTLYCYTNDITSLNVTNATALEYLQCYGNLFTSLNVNTNTNLKELRCSDGELLSIDVSNNILLEDFRCWGNQLTGLDISNNPAITIFTCDNNSLASLNAANGNNTNIVTFSATNNTNLLCIEVDDEAYSTANWTNISSQSSFSEDCNASAPTIAIPDDNFETALIDLGIDTNGFTGDILQSEAEAVTSLNINNKNISSLIGIEGFVNLSVLQCENNNLTSLDLSNNLALMQLDCSHNQLTTLLLGNNIVIYELLADNNQLTALNIENNTALSSILIGYNQITNMDASNNLQLFELSVTNNQLTSLNVKNGNNVNIDGVYATNNPNLYCIEVDDVAYSEANWTDIDAQTNFSEDCSIAFPTIAIPDANFEQALIDLGYDTNGFTGDILHNDAVVITDLFVPNKSISSIEGIQGFVSLLTLDVSYNQLTTIDISDNSHLTVLNVIENSLTNIDTSANLDLTEFIASYNPLISVDVGLNLELRELFVFASSLINLDVSNNLLLEKLGCGNSQLISLDVSNNTALTTFSCHSNQLTSLNIKNGNNPNITTFNAGSNPNLICIEVDSIAYSEANWTNIDAQTNFSEDCGYDAPTIAIPDANFEQALIDLGYDTNGFTGNILQSEAEAVTNLDVANEFISNATGIEGFINLIELRIGNNDIEDLEGINSLEYLGILVCNNNDLTSLNISNNTALKELHASGNAIDNLDVSNNILLESLTCSTCQLTNIDISNNTDLTYLELYDNQLTTLDISNNLDLEELSFASNQITSMDLSNHIALIEIYAANNQLTSFNVKNGNNTIITDFEADNNPNLYCIQVDSAPYSTALWSSYVDAQTSFDENCESLGVNEEILFDTVSLYPNPSSEVFYVKGLQEDSQIKIYDINGRSILATRINSNQSVNVSQIPSGIYLVNIKNNSGETVKKLVVN